VIEHKIGGSCRKLRYLQAATAGAAVLRRSRFDGADQSARWPLPTALVAHNPKDRRRKLARERLNSAHGFSNALDHVRLEARVWNASSPDLEGFTDGMIVDVFRNLPISNFTELCRYRSPRRGIDPDRPFTAFSAIEIDCAHLTLSLFFGMLLAGLRPTARQALDQSPLTSLRRAVPTSWR